LSPTLSSLVSVFTVPDIAPIIPTNCFSISIFSAEKEIEVNKNEKIN
jgi:hypothetical protein